MKNMKGPKSPKWTIDRYKFTYTHIHTDEEETPSGEIFILPPTASILPWVTTGM